MSQLMQLKKRPVPIGEAGASRAPRAGRVLFLLMPWAAVNHGGLGIATLAATLKREGFEVDCVYPNIELARRIGLDVYEFIQATGVRSKLSAELFFTQRYFDLPIDAFVEDALRAYCANARTTLKIFGRDLRESMDDEIARRFETVFREQIPAFLSALEQSISWEKYDVIGFSLMFHQRLASLCLAKWIKQTFPDKTIVFGGASCFSEMGVETIRSFPEVDVVATGEADEIIVPLVAALRSGAPLDSIPGIAFRRDGRVVVTPTAPPLRDLDWLPAPDYEDYVRAVRSRDDLEPQIYFETSRGCWWGQKHLCSFCGLNAEGLVYRRKSPARALSEIQGHFDKWIVKKLWCADNILDLSYFNDVIPELARRNAALGPEERFSFMYETKSNLKKSQFELLKRAGIDDIQPGIESFSDHVLELMKKGATGIQQVRCVRWATELDIRLSYGILHGSPGERPEDYDEMARMIEFIDHLAPPLYVEPIALDRFSPYHIAPADYGIGNVRPKPGDETTFPDPRIDLMKLAYSFDFDHPDRSDEALRRAVGQCVERFNQWRASYQPDLLVYEDRPDGVYVLDRRGGRRRAVALRGVQADLFRYCDDVRSMRAIRARWPLLEESRLDAFLGALVAKRWMYRDATDHFLSLPVRRAFLDACRPGAISVTSPSREALAGERL